MSKSLKFAIVYFSITAVLCVLAIVLCNYYENRKIEDMRNDVRIEYTEVEYVCTNIKTNTYQTYNGEITSETAYYFDPTDTETFDDWDYGFCHKGTTNLNTEEPFMLYTAHVSYGFWYLRVNSDNLPLEDFAASLKSELDEKISTYVRKNSPDTHMTRIALFIGCAILILIGTSITCNLKD